MQDYRDMTAEVLDFYGKRQCLAVIDAAQSEDEVQAAIMAAIGRIAHA